MDRRDFLRLSAVGLVGLGINPTIEAAERWKRKKGKDSSYSIVILGDTHYDVAPDSVYHTGYSDPNPTREANHRKEFVRNAEMWSDKCPRLVKRAACLVDDRTKAVFQTGDLIQGDCAGVEIHEKMLDDAFNYIKDMMGPLPFVTVAGNHDLRGKDDSQAREGYLNYMPKRLSSELGTEVGGTDFAFRIGPDVFITVDFTVTDDKTVERLLEESKDARYTFILCHAPVFPYEGKYCTWYYHGRDAEPQARDRMLALFAKRNAIVLCGHTHTTDFMDWSCKDGRITQMTMNSVWKNDKVGKYVVSAEGPEQYGSLTKGPKEVFDEFRDGIRTYIRSNAAGSYKLNVSEDEVTVDFYAGDDARPSAHFKLR